MNPQAMILMSMLEKAANNFFVYWGRATETKQIVDMVAVVETIAPTGYRIVIERATIYRRGRVDDFSCTLVESEKSFLIRGSGYSEFAAIDNLLSRMVRHRPVAEWLFDKFMEAAA